MTHQNDKATKAKALAKRLGCILDVNKSDRIVSVRLPRGKQFPGNSGVNVRVNNCETMEDNWQATLDVLQDLSAFGMEDNEMLLKA